MTRIKPVAPAVLKKTFRVESFRGQPCDIPFKHNLFELSFQRPRGTIIDAPSGYLAYLLCDGGTRGAVHVWSFDSVARFQVLGKADIGILDNPSARRLSAFFEPASSTGNQPRRKRPPEPPEILSTIPDLLQNRIRREIPRGGNLTLGGKPMRAPFQLPFGQSASPEGILHLAATGVCVERLGYFTSQPDLIRALGSSILPAMGVSQRKLAEGFAREFGHGFRIAREISQRRIAYCQQATWTEEQTATIGGKTFRLGESSTLEGNPAPVSLIGLVKTASLPAEQITSLARQYGENDQYAVFERSRSYYGGFYTLPADD